MKTLCVYCGSRPGKSEKYADAAKQLAQEMVKNDIALVYGGGDIGMMGIIADEVLRLGGDVTGVIPTGLLEMEVAHQGLTRMHIVKDMHERKAMMMNLSDGFIALPGGLGTLEELFEVLTWSQLRYHSKPVGLLNASGFYDGLLAFLQYQVDTGFVSEKHKQMLMVDTDPALLVARLRSMHFNV